MTTETNVREQSDAKATEERITLNVTGMTCAACATRIEKNLSKVEGVRQAGIKEPTKLFVVVAPIWMY
jgi:Cu+-exporting ATPase